MNFERELLGKFVRMITFKASRRKLSDSQFPSKLDRNFMHRVYCNAHSRNRGSLGPTKSTGFGLFRSCLRCTEPTHWGRARFERRNAEVSFLNCPVDQVCLFPLDSPRENELLNLSIGFISPEHFLSERSDKTLCQARPSRIPKARLTNAQGHLCVWISNGFAVRKKHQIHFQRGSNTNNSNPYRNHRPPSPALLSTSLRRFCFWG